MQTFESLNLPEQPQQQVFDFLLERFRAWYADEGIKANIFQSVLAVKPVSPLDFHRRVQAVSHFSSLDQASALAAANKRVANLLDKLEETTLTDQIDEGVLQEAAEKALYDAVRAKRTEVTPLFDAGNYTEGLQALADLKSPVDEFFDAVLVMADDEQLKQNRLALLKQLRNLFLRSADISYLHAS